MMASIELVDDRYDDFATIGGPTQIADNAFDAGGVLGAPVTRWHGLDLAALTARTLARRPADRRGPQRRAARPSAGCAGLARHQAARGLGLGLAAGTFVSLGTITPVQWVEGPSLWRIEVEGLGAVSVRVA